MGILGYFGKFFSGILVYHYPPPTPLDDPVRWGSDSQHLHTRFNVKRRSTQVQATNAPNSKKFPPRPNRQPQASYTTPICRQFVSMFVWYQTVTGDTPTMNITQPPRCDSQLTPRQSHPPETNRPGYETLKLIMTGTLSLTESQTVFRLFLAIAFWKRQRLETTDQPPQAICAIK